MVRPAVLFLLMSLALDGFCKENLALGQDLYSYLRDHPPSMKSAGRKILGIPEGTVDFYKYKAQTDKNDIKILVILEKYFVGVLQSENGKSHLLYDLTGDGVLDAEVTEMEVPYWVVARNTEEKQKTSKNNIKQYLDGYYQMFQQDANPFTSGKFVGYADTILKKVVSGSIDNRDILYALYCSYKWGNSYLAGAVSSVEYLAKNYLTRFQADHARFYLQFLELDIKL